MMRALTLRDSRATTTAEFAVIAPLFFALVLGIIEMGLAFYWWKSAEKAAQLGVRMAVVRDPVAPGVPLVNVKTADGVLGVSCSEAPSPCTGFASVECRGPAECTEPAFDMVVARMQHVFPVIEPENVRVRYEYAGVGFAGGPSVPAVSVTVTELDFPLFMLGLIFELFGDTTTAPAVLPDIRATMTGEDLAT